MAVQILETLSVSNDQGEPLPPARRRVAELLTVLAAHGSWMEGDTLAELIGIALHSVRQTTNLARQYLGRDRLEMQRGYGYRLVLGSADVLDLRLFRARRDAGMVARRRNDQREAAASLGAALSLWTGDVPLRTLPTTTEADLRLTQGLLRERDTTREAWVRSRLLLGEHAALIGDLEALITQDPIDERWWEFLMVAYFRSGRRDTALEVFDRATTQLAAEGITPGDRLQLLRTRIHRKDPDLLAPAVPEVSATANSTERRPVPRQLPPAAADFTGRGHEVERLEKLLGRTEGMAPTHVVLTGPPGIGTSALALHVAHRIRDRFPDGQFYFNLAAHGHSPTRVADVLAEYLRLLGVPDAGIPTTEAERANLFRTLTADRQILVVLDNASTISQVQPLLPASAGSATVITANNRLLTLAGASLMQVGPLPTAEATALLRRLVGDRRVDAEPAASADITDACAGVPLALRIAGARLASRPTWTLSAFATDLSSGHQALEQLSAGDLRVKDSIGRRYEQLDDRQAQTLQAIALLGPASYAPWLVSLLLSEDCSATLAELADINLIEDAGIDDLGRPRYQISALIRAFCTRLIADDDASAAAGLAHAVAASIELTALADAHIYRPPTLPPSAAPPRRSQHTKQADNELVDNHPQTWLHTEWSALAALAEQAAEHDLHHAAKDLALNLTPYLTVTSREHHLATLWAHLRDRALQADAITVAVEAGFRAAAAATCLPCQRGRVTAELEQLLPDLERHHEQRILIQALTTLAEAHTLTGRPQSARQHATRAARLARDCQDTYGEMTAHRILALSLASSCAIPPARQHADVALALARHLDQPLYVSGALLAQMFVLRHTGDYDEAIEAGGAALAIADAHGHLAGVATISQQLGEAYLTIDDAAHGVPLLERAVAAYESLGDGNTAILCRFALGRAIVTAAADSTTELHCGQGPATKPARELAHEKFSQLLPAPAPVPAGNVVAPAGTVAGATTDVAGQLSDAVERPPNAHHSTQSSRKTQRSHPRTTAVVSGYNAN
jgi:DNA-binding SARP family transcriptional activator